MSDWEDLCKKHKAWDEVKQDIRDNGLSDDAPWKRCVKYLDINYMTDDCWSDLLTAYPQS